MKRLAALVVLLVPTSAHAAPPAAVVQASALTGAAPMTVTLTATGDAASWHWDFGDGRTGDGAVVTHTFGVGRHVATLTATSAAGETTQIRTRITAYALSLRTPPVATWGKRVVLAGRLTPAERGVVSLYRGRERVSTAKLKAGAWRVVTRLAGGGPYYARFEGVRSQPRRIAVRPVLEATIRGASVVGGRVELVARLRPRAAGRVHVRVLRGTKSVFRRVTGGAVRVRLGTAVPGDIRVALRALPAAGYAGTTATLKTTVVHPSLGPGSRGASVRALERRLRELRFALKGADGLYAHDTYEAVLAFQKTHGLRRTGRVDATLWRRLLAANAPRPRYLGGSHIEVDKSRQLLIEVRNGRVVSVLHVSTGATGNTPLGRWRVYRKVPGWDWVLWYPMYFKGGFAIHGYPSVPPWPASHGCVRVPMWFAPQLYARYPYGTAVIVYS